MASSSIIICYFISPGLLGLTTVPLSLSHVNETTLSTPKSSLWHTLKQKELWQPKMKLMFNLLMQHFFFTFTRIPQLILAAQQHISLGKFYKETERWFILFLISESEGRNATDISYHIADAAQKLQSKLACCSWQF